jgi:hypothetical protein
MCYWKTENIAHAICLVVEDEIPIEIGRLIVSDLFWRSVMHRRALEHIVLASHRQDTFWELVQICDLLTEDNEIVDGNE